MEIETTETVTTTPTSFLKSRKFIVNAALVTVAVVTMVIVHQVVKDGRENANLLNPITPTE